jgi:hypothetical protein
MTAGPLAWLLKAKTQELKSEMASVEVSVEQLNAATPDCVELALEVFDWCQNAAEIWQRSNNYVRREILKFICLNRIVDDVSLYTTKRKPFDVFAKGLSVQSRRGDCPSFEPLLGQFVDAFLQPQPEIEDYKHLYRNNLRLSLGRSRSRRGPQMALI